jgi:hypothetical protein
MGGLRLPSVDCLPLAMRKQALEQLAPAPAAAETLPKKRQQKYGATPVEIDKIRFHSTAEGERYKQLVLLRAGGVITRFHRQVIFDLPGGTQYRCDFQIFWADGRVAYEDVKGFETAEFIFKRKQVRALYNVEIEIP